MKDITYIGIGASAGGLRALQELLTLVPANNSFVYIIFQHISKDHKSQLSSLLSSVTSIPIIVPNEDSEFRPGNIYIIPPACSLGIKNQQLYVSKCSLEAPAPHPSIDQGFVTLAQMPNAKSIGIILSGTGHDGTEGLKSIHTMGGITIAQLPSEADFEGMPRQAINAKTVDQVLPIASIAEVLHIFSRNEDNSEEDLLEGIRVLLYASEGIDLDNYKEKTVWRRIKKRMLMLHIDTVANYFSYMIGHNNESRLLYQDLLIGVTCFFREKEAFASLTNILRKKIITLSQNSEFRIWVPACSTGEEVYSVTIVLLELLEEANFKLNIKVLATDIDDIALKAARLGRYSLDAFEEFPLHLREKYFTKYHNSFEVIEKIRKMVLFTHHDLLQDPPFLKTDLISCRNALIYFKASTQQEIFTLFYSSLKDDGLLFLGISENATQHVSYFDPIDTQWKIYKKSKLSKTPKIPKRFFRTLSRPNLTDYAHVPTENHFSELEKLIVKSTYEFFIDSAIVINEHDEIIFKKGKIPYLEFSDGFTSLNVFKNLHPALRHEMRTLLQNLNTSDIESKYTKFVEIKDMGSNSVFVRVMAKGVLVKPNNLFTLIYFQELKDDELLYAGGTLEIPDESKLIASLQTQLSQTTTQLQFLQDEYELLNENMQMVHEELQSSNEELQASNEELETSNEELQASNEELRLSYNNVNNLQKKLKLILDATPEGVLGFDKKGKHTFVNKSASKLLGYSSEFLIGREGHNLWHHSYKDATHYDEKDCPIENVRSSGKEIRGTEIFWRKDGNQFEVGYVCSPIFEDEKITGSVLFFSDITEKMQLQRDYAKEQERIQRYLEVVGVILLVLDLDGNVISINTKGLHILQETQQSILGKNWFENYTAPQERKDVFEVFNALLNSKEDEILSYTNYIITSSGDKRLILWTNTILRDENGNVTNVIAAGNDITEMSELKERLVSSEKLYTLTFEQANVGIAHVGVDGSWLHVNNKLCEIVGYTKEELHKLTFQDITYKDDLNKDLDYVSELLDGKIDNYQMEKRYIRKDKTLTWVYLSVRIVRDKKNKAKYFIAAITDINKEKEIEQELIKSKDTLEEAQHIAKIGSWEYYPQTDTHHWSDEIYEIYGRDKSLPPKNMQDISQYFTPESWSRLLEHINKAVETGEAYSCEAELIRADGESRWVTASGTSMLDELGNQIGLRGTLQDITEKTQLNNMFIAQSRLAAMGEMLSMIAHQWRQPLSIISMSANNLLADVDLELLNPQDTKKEAHSVLNQTKYLSQTINDFKNFYKEDKQRESVTLSTLIDDAMRIAVQSLNSNEIIFEQDLKSTSSIPVFRREVQQVIINLISNAKDALKESKQSDKKIKISTSEDEKNAYILICDNGGGIDPKIMGVIFDPYFTTKDEKNGTGLGLYMSKMIIEKHMKGTLKAQNVDKGVCFKISMPKDLDE